MKRQRRGRPPGSGVRWTPEWERDIWARVEAIRHQTGLDIVNACRRLAHTGYFQLKRVAKGRELVDGKAWVTRPPTAADHAPVHAVFAAIRAGSLRAGDARSEVPAMTFRSRYYAARRRMLRDQAFRSECLFWKRVYIRVSNGEDPVEAFLAESC